MNTEDRPPRHPFDHIALSLSGGGVRAVGYHLGTLDYLDRSALLPQVHTLSSVSGGSLVAIGYALSLKKGEDFQEFYDNICEFLPELNTMEELLKVMRRREPPVASGARTLITAMAEVYHEKFFDRYYGDPPFGIFWEPEPEIPLKEIIFNATEFKTGIAFRFQKSPFASLIGNGKVWIDQQYAKQIRMSDIMAASSCIPVAMEPLRFPQDFHWPDDPAGGRPTSTRPTCEAVEQSLLEQADVKSIPLMDGGVYDNQGITSIILSVARNHQCQDATGTTTLDDMQAGLEPVRPHKWAKWVLSSMERASDVRDQKDLGDVDLFIVSDTPVRKDPMYEVETKGTAGRGRIERFIRHQTLGTVNLVATTITALLAISIFALANAPLTDSLTYSIFYRFETVFLTVLALLTTIGLVMLRRKGESMAAKIAKTMPPMERSMWSYAKSLRVGTLLDMASLRASSMSALTARIFMNRIRQLGYSLLYSHDEFRKRVMDNNINDIKSLAEGHSEEMPDFVTNPSEVLEDVVERAASMGTKLWIEKPDHDRHDLDVLIAAGHVSTCFNVIEYLWEFRRDENGDLTADVQELFDFAKADWQRFNENPYWLVDQRNEAGRKPGGLFWMKDHQKRGRLSRLRAKLRKTA